MTRKLKTLGLTLVAVLAMSSVITSTASAATDLFSPTENPVTLTYNQHNGNNRFILAGQSVECTTAKGSATVSSSPSEVVTTEVPTYSGCTYGSNAASVTMNGCRYILTGTTQVDGDATAKVECDGANKIELTVNSIKCKVFVAGQTATEGYTITNIGAGMTEELTLHITAKVNVTSVGDASEGITCASLTNGTGTLSGTMLVTGEKETPPHAHIGVTFTP